MKRTVGLLAGMATLGIAAYLGTMVWGQQPTYTQPAAAQPARPATTPIQTRVAVVNMIQVVKSYKKCQSCEEQVKQLYMSGDAQLEQKKKILASFKTEMESPQTAVDRRTQIEKDWHKVQRDMEELAEEYKQKGAKMRGELAVVIYKEIEDAVGAYARANGVELVMSYNDALPTNPAEYYSPMNVQRKLQSGGCTPMYITPGMDVTNSIINMLNTRYQPTTAAPGAVVPRSN